MWRRTSYRPARAALSWVTVSIAGVRHEGRGTRVGPPGAAQSNEPRPRGVTKIETHMKRFFLLAPALFSASVTLAQPARQKPTLVVLIAVDQMRADYLERFDKQLTGGLARLYHGGAVFTNAYQDHAITETAPGHSVMLSGRFPRGTGIVTNAEGVNGTPYPVIDANQADAAPIRFRGTTLVDWLHSADP